MKILQGITAAANLFDALCKARKEGASAVRITPLYNIPAVTFKPAYLNTIEGCQTWKCGDEADRAVMDVFNSLPYEVQRKLEFSPKSPGEWILRARFWQAHLRPALPPEMYHEVMLTLVSWYAHCLRQDTGAAV